MHLLLVKDLDQGLHEIVVADMREEVVGRLVHGQVDQPEGEPHHLGMAGLEPLPDRVGYNFGAAE